MHLSPIDMLSLYESDQDVIRCLIRRPQLTAAEISRITKIPISEINDVLGRLLQKSRVAKGSRNGNEIFSVQYESKKRAARGATTLLDSLFG